MIEHEVTIRILQGSDKCGYDPENFLKSNQHIISYDWLSLFAVAEDSSVWCDAYTANIETGTEEQIRVDYVNWIRETCGVSNTLNLNDIHVGPRSKQSIVTYVGEGN